MECALWLNRKKIRTAAEIPENLDIASLRGYFVAGSLVPWLEEHNGKRFAKRLAALRYDDPSLNEKIAAVFGGAANTAPYKELDGKTANAPDVWVAAVSSFDFSGIGSSGSYNYSVLTSFGSYFGFLQSLTSYEFGSLSSSFKLYEWEQLIKLLGGSSFTITSGGSFSYGWEWLWSFLQSYIGGSSSFTVTSGGSFSYGWEWLWSFLQSYIGGSSSFTVTSGGSFSYGWEWLWSFLQSYIGGSSSFTVTSGGSFTYGWEWLFRLLNGFGSFGGQLGSFKFGNFGSFGSLNTVNLPANIDEYDLILLKTLINCPLDRFGYGIHNI